MVWLYFTVRMLFTTFYSSPLSNLICSPHMQHPALGCWRKGSPESVQLLQVEGGLSLTVSFFQVWQVLHILITIFGLYQLCIWSNWKLILSLLYFWWSTKDMIDFPKESLLAYIEVKTFKSSGMSSSSVSLDNWSFKTVWINSSDCPGAIASANVFSSYCLNRINLPFKSLLVFSLNSSTFFCLIWYRIGLENCH